MRMWVCVHACVCILLYQYALNSENMYILRMCKRLGPVWVRCSKHPLLLLAKDCQTENPFTPSSLSFLGGCSCPCFSQDWRSLWVHGSMTRRCWTWLKSSSRIAQRLWFLFYRLPPKSSSGRVGFHQADCCRPNREEIFIGELPFKGPNPALSHVCHGEAGTHTHAH